MNPTHFFVVGFLFWRILVLEILIINLSGLNITFQGLSFLILKRYKTS